MDREDSFTIRQMIELTGLSEFTIRGWENRYSAFHPHRTETGRREYRKSDIERALLIRELVKRGYKVGKIAKLTNKKLQEVFETMHDSKKLPAHKKNLQHASQAIDLMSLQKWTELDSFIKKIPTKNASELIHNFFLPALAELSALVVAGNVSVAQEHIFSSLLKEKIYSLLSVRNFKKASRVGTKMERFVLATPEGDYHEIGLLLAHLLICSYGFTSLYLGSHTPAQDLSETALRFGSSHLLIVSTVSKKAGGKQDLFAYISDVQKMIGDHLKILVAGPQVSHSSAREDSAILRMTSFHDLEDYLKTLEKNHSPQIDKEV